MEFPLAYCAGGSEVLERLRRLYERRDQDIVLASMHVPSAAVAAFAETHAAGYCDYPDPNERVRFWDACLRERAAIRDDSVPSAYPSEMDQGLYGGLVGGDVRFLCDPGTGWISSMVPPILNDWSEFDHLAIRQDHPWFERYRRQLEVFVEGARGQFGISHFILINGLNFVFELVGATQTYLDIIDRPDRVRQAIDFAHELNCAVQETFFEHVPLVDGGTCSNMVQWMPGRIISESVDPFHMTSVDYFHEWGLDPLERIIARFDGGVVHIHGNGRHLLEAVAAVNGLKAIYLADDIGFARAFDVLDELKQKTGDMPLLCGVGYEAFERALTAGRLLGGVFYHVSGVPDADTANRCMDRVRARCP